MSRKTITPGPWAAFTDDINEHTNIVAFKERTDCVFSLPGRDKREPDVQLIAAAPELLEALERARDAIGAAIDALPTGWARETCEHEIEVARAAIAKAKGGEA